MSKNTKNVLGGSLKKLLQKKALNKITVTEIVEDCGLNRMTFYYHFKDIYDLLEWVCADDARKALESMGNYTNWREGMHSIFELMRSEKGFITNLYHSPSGGYLETYLLKLTDDVFMTVINDIDAGKRLKPEDKTFIASFYKSAILGIIFAWIDNDMKDEPADIIERLAILSKNGFKEAVQELGELNIQK